MSKPLPMTSFRPSVTAPERPPMECYPSKLKLLGLLSLTAALVAMFYFLTTLPGVISHVVGWIGISFFGLGLIAIPVMFFRTGAQFVINHEGIEDRRAKIGVIRWEDIRSLSIGSVNSAKFLCIELNDPDVYVSRLPRLGRALTSANKMMGFSTLTLSLSGLSPGIKEAWAYLRDREGSEPVAVLEPESRFIVRLSDTEVACERPDGNVERVNWVDLQKVEVVTTSAGPFEPDVFWVLHGTQGGCAVPQGATGDRELLARLQALPGFDNGAVIDAMASVKDRRFLCWEKK